MGTGEQALLDAIITQMDGTDAAPFEDAVPVLTSLLTSDVRTERAYNRWIRERARSLVPHMASEDVDAAGRVMSAMEDMLMLDAPHDLDAFMQAMEWDREPSKRFYLPRRHVLWPIVSDLQDLEDGRIRFLSISLPPRVGKSTTGCFFMAWRMGRHPEDANLMSGHSDKLTASFYREVLSLVTDEQYRYARIFPDAPLVATNAQDETISLVRKGRFPSLTCRSVIGTLTGAVEVGRRGCLYCDDMVEDYEQALSENRMDHLYEAYLNQLKDRKLDGAAEVHVGTRWVPNDIIGRIEAEHADDPSYRFVSIPALDVSKASTAHPYGESNFVYQHGLGFSTEYYEDMRDSLVSAGAEDSWDAKYMCKPFWKEGRLFTADDLQWYDELPEGEPDAVIAVCDTKTRGPDYCVQPIGYVYGGRHYIHSVICDDGLMEGIVGRLVEDLVANGVDMARYESNVAGGVIARQVEDSCRERGLAIEVSTRYTTQNKETRILADSGWVKQNCLFRSDADRGRDYDVFINQLMSYSAKGRNLHDDAADAMSMYRRFASSGVSAQAECMARPW